MKISKQKQKTLALKITITIHIYEKIYIHGNLGNKFERPLTERIK